MEEPRPRRSFTPEFKAKLVDLCQRGDRSVGQVGQDFELTGTSAASAQGRPSLCEDERLASGQTFTMRVSVPVRVPAGQLRGRGLVALATDEHVQAVDVDSQRDRGAVPGRAEPDLLTTQAQIPRRGPHALDLDGTDLTLGPWPGNEPAGRNSHVHGLMRPHRPLESKGSLPPLSASLKTWYQASVLQARPGGSSE